ncbi:MAG: leucyl/phenylalanyl-tRNA--protein transferase [Betaproteobacteria bacterium]
MIPWLDVDTPFPALDEALVDPNGLLAAGGDLSPQRLIAAYRRGIFPWYSGDQPILWWSPDPRMVLHVAEFQLPRSLRKRIRAGTFQTRFDTAFRQVIEQCAATPRAGQGGTWITSAIVDAYCALHELGYAHSVESWQHGQLVGGLYGIEIDRMFFGESMFAHATDASKVALAALVAQMQRRGIPLIDCQQETAHLASLGARPISRGMFAAQLVDLVHSSAPSGPWQSDFGTGAAWPSLSTGAR